MPADPTTPAPTAAELLDVLRAVRDALDIPHAATFGHDETRTEILQQRVTRRDRARRGAR